MAILSRKGIKCKGLVMNSKKVLKPDFSLFFNFWFLEEFGLKIFLKKNILFFNLKSFQVFLRKNYPNSVLSQFKISIFLPKNHG